MRTTLFVLGFLLVAASAAQDFEKFTPSHLLRDIRSNKTGLRNLEPYAETAMIPTRDGINLYTTMTFYPTGAVPEVFNTILIRTPYSADQVAPLYAALGQPGFAIVIQVIVFFFFFFFFVLILCFCCS